MNDTVKLAIPSAEHPLAGRNRTGAQMVVQAIADEGLEPGRRVLGHDPGVIEDRDPAAQALRLGQVVKRVLAVCERETVERPYVLHRRSGQ